MGMPVEKDGVDPYPAFEEDANKQYDELVKPIMYAMGFVPKLDRPGRWYICEDRNKGNVWWKNIQWHYTHPKYGDMHTSIFWDDLRHYHSIPGDYTSEQIVELSKIHFCIECPNGRYTEGSFWLDREGHWAVAFRTAIQGLAGKIREKKDGNKNT